MADRAAEPSPARAPAAVFELPSELRAASPSTSDIVVMGLERWEGAQRADSVAIFREFCTAALCLPARLFAHVAVTCVVARAARDGRRSFLRLRLPSAAAAAVLAARHRLQGARCPVSLDVPRSREEQMALWSLRSQLSAGRADPTPSRADASLSWRRSGVPVEPQGIASAPAPASASAPVPAPTPASAPAPAFVPASTHASVPAASPSAPRLPSASTEEGMVVGITDSKRSGRAVLYHARVIAAGVEGHRWLPASEIPPAVLAAWRRQCRRDQCRACRARQSASQPAARQQRQPPSAVQQSASQQRQRPPSITTVGTRRSLRLAASA
ncbi:hypothetical protein ABPG75_013814 [Micractinium tetrahymenae]